MLIITIVVIIIRAMIISIIAINDIPFGLSGTASDLCDLGETRAWSQW